MTKQLTTTIASISNSQLAPTTISPTAASGGASPAATPTPNTSGTATNSTTTSTTTRTQPPAVPAPPVPPPPPPPPPPPKTGRVSPASRTLSVPPPSAPGLTTTATPSVGLIAGRCPVAAAAPNRSPAANDASGRSAALERAYVHDVYENCEEPTGSIRPRVAQFLGNLDPGSIVCDVGCGSGRYLTQCNPAICTVGVDRCYRLSKVARSQGGEVALCDNLELPFRDESFDAVLSLAVVHHFATTERRIRALRELARILRIGGRVVITVWALEQRHRRFESQDVLIPWQPPKNRNFNCSDEEDDEEYLPPYHAYTEDSTNSSRSAGDGDSSSLSSSSPGESCYSFVRRAIQKLAGGRKHPWFLDSWTSKDTKNDSSLDYEDAKDLPIELRRLEDFEDFVEPPLSAGLKSRSLGSILNPPPRQIVRSRSSVPSLGGVAPPASGGVELPAPSAGVPGVLVVSNSAAPNGPSVAASSSLGRRPKLIKQKQSLCDDDYSAAEGGGAPGGPYHLISAYQSSTNSVSSSLGARQTAAGYYYRGDAMANQHFGMPLGQHAAKSPLSARQMAQASVFLRKQSSLNEELMAGNRIREKERVRKRIQKQISLNEAFLCRSQLLSKRLQVIREGVTSKIKSSTGSLERVTKTGLTKIMENFKGSQADGVNGDGPHEAQTNGPAAGGDSSTSVTADGATDGGQTLAHSVPQTQCLQHQQHHHHHHQHQPQGFGLLQSHFSHLLHKQRSSEAAVVAGGPVYYCNNNNCASTTGCYCKAYHNDCGKCSGCLASSGKTPAETEEQMARRHSRESGSDSSKDSLQSDTSIESEDSFASVIFIPKPEQHQQQLQYQQQHSQNSNSSSSNSSSSNGHHHGHAHQQHGMQQQPQHHHQMLGKAQLTMNGTCGHSLGGHQAAQQQHYQRGSSVPTSPLIMPCPPTPAHSPAAAQASVTSPPQSVAAVTAAMAILTPPSKSVPVRSDPKNRFNFDAAHIRQQQQKEEVAEPVKPPPPKPVLIEREPKLEEKPAPPKITRQTIKDLPPIPKFRKQQSLQLHRQSFPIVRRSSASSSSTLPTSIPKLMSLELFNPLTDDLDSDSSEPSSPDSIDSVISAPKSVQSHGKEEEATEGESNKEHTASDELNVHSIQEKQRQYHSGDLKINPSAPNDIILNDDSANILPTVQRTPSKQPQDCAAFAEQLSAQLMRELEDKSHGAECRSLDGISDIGEYLDDPLFAGKRRNGGGGGERDLTALRDELRERRLMLANLSTQPSLQQSPTTSSSTSSRSFTIHEEDEDDEENERSYTLQMYENCKVSKFDYKRNRQYNLHPETAYLLQDDGDSSIRDDDDMEDFEHDVILEEDEESLEAERKQEQLLGLGGAQGGSQESQASEGASKEDQKKAQSPAAAAAAEEEQPRQRSSAEAWEHSNSSTSLDSPSQGGGSSTHHRYYHVFREGELDALINHHVASLHIVSSYYERASWCVVAEKVQVWTI